MYMCSVLWIHEFVLRILGIPRTIFCKMLFILQKAEKNIRNPRLLPYGYALIPEMYSTPFKRVQCKLHLYNLVEFSGLLEERVLEIIFIDISLTNPQSHQHLTCVVHCSSVRMTTYVHTHETHIIIICQGGTHIV